MRGMLANKVLRGLPAHLQPVESVRVVHIMAGAAWRGSWCSATLNVRFTVPHAAWLRVAGLMPARPALFPDKCHLVTAAQPAGSLVARARSLDQARAVVTFLDAASEKTLRSTVALTAARRVAFLSPVLTIVSSCAYCLICGGVLYIARTACQVRFLLATLPIMRSVESLAAAMFQEVHHACAATSVCRVACEGVTLTVGTSAGGAGRAPRWGWRSRARWRWATATSSCRRPPRRTCARCSSSSSRWGARACKAPDACDTMRKQGP